MLSYHMDVNQLFCSSAVNMFISMYVCMCGPVQPTCDAQEYQVRLTKHNGHAAEIQIATTLCPSGWYQYRFYPALVAPEVPDDTTIDRRVVCRQCSRCDDGVETISECTQIKDVRCSKKCMNPSFVYDEGTKSCQSQAFLARGSFEAFHYSTNMAPGASFRTTRSASTDINRMPTSQGRLRQQSPVRQNGDRRRHLDGSVQQDEDSDDVPVHKVFYKDPNVLFVASGVIFVLLLMMLIPQIVVKLQQWSYCTFRRSYMPGARIEMTREAHNESIIVVDGIQLREISTEHNFPTADTISVTDTESEDSLSISLGKEVIGEGSPKLTHQYSIDESRPYIIYPDEECCEDDDDVMDIDTKEDAVAKYVNDDGVIINESNICHGNEGEGWYGTIHGGISACGTNIKLTCPGNEQVDHNTKPTLQDMECDSGFGSNTSSPDSPPVGNIPHFQSGVYQHKGNNESRCLTGDNPCIVDSNADTSNMPSSCDSSLSFDSSLSCDSSQLYDSRQSSDSSKSCDSTQSCDSSHSCSSIHGHFSNPMASLQQDVLNTSLREADIDFSKAIDTINSPGDNNPSSDMMTQCSDRTHSKGHGRPPANNSGRPARRYSCEPGYTRRNITRVPTASVSIGYEKNVPTVLILDQPRFMRTRQMSLP